MINDYSAVSAQPSGSAATVSPGNNSGAVATTQYVDRGVWGWNQVGFKEDFLNTPGSAISTAVVWTADTTWIAAQVSGGSTTTSQNLSHTFLNPGQVSFTTPAISGQGVYIGKGNLAGSAGTFGALGSNAGWELNWIAKISATTNICLRIGLVGTGQAAADAPTGGIYVEYDTANTGNTNTNFTWVTRSASTPTYSTTNAIAADTNFHRFRIRSLVAGTILFSVDGGTEASIATNVPTVIMAPFFQVITRTTATATATLDFCSFVSTNART